MSEKQKAENIYSLSGEYGKTIQSSSPRDECVMRKQKRKIIENIITVKPRYTEHAADVIKPSSGCNIQFREIQEIGMRTHYWSSGRTSIGVEKAILSFPFYSK